MKRIITKFILLLLVIICFYIPVVAQKKSCTLEVRVTEANEGDWESFFYFDPDVITDHTPPLAIIRLYNVATGETKVPAIIRDEGSVAAFTKVFPGQYQIIVTAYGYKRTVKKIKMPSCTYPTYNIETKLYDGEITQTITLGISIPKQGKHTSILPPSDAKLTAMKWKETVSPNSLKILPKEDPGVDLAVVTVARTYLRRNADLLGDIEQELNRGDLLALIDRNPVDYMYNVIHILTGKEGWIKVSQVDIKYTQNPRAAPIFEERRVSSDRDPVLIVENGTDRILSLRLGTELHTIASNSHQTITVSPGNYRFYGSVPNALPTFGEREFPKGMVFTWKFYIIRR